VAGVVGHGSKHEQHGLTESPFYDAHTLNRANEAHVASHDDVVSRMSTLQDWKLLNTLSKNFNAG
jgi:hypothetical protein